MLSDFNPDVFFLFFLPVIIFESSYGMNKVHFLRNIGTICLFAFVGTAISVGVVGFGLWGSGKLGLTTETNIFDTLAFASLISAVDPVATLAIFSQLSVSPLLYMVVFGESVLNDAVSVVLFRSMTSYSASDGPLGLLLIPLTFIGVAVGSVLLGVVVALITAAMFRLLSLKHARPMEIALLLAASFMAYFIAEAAHLSGIMTLLAVAMIGSHYTHQSLSPESRAAVHEILRAVSFVCESAVFFYLGTSVFTIKHSLDEHTISFFALTFVLCMLGRGLNVFPLTFIANRFRSYPIPGNFAVIQFFSGLRGAVAFALVLAMTGPSSSLYMTTTLAMVIATIGIFGTGTMPLLKLLRVDQIHLNSHQKIMQNGLAKHCGPRSTALLVRLGVFADTRTKEEMAEHYARPTRLELWDAKYIVPLLTNELTPRQLWAKMRGLPPPEKKEEAPPLMPMVAKLQTMPEMPTVGSVVAAKTLGVRWRSRAGLAAAARDEEGTASGIHLTLPDESATVTHTVETDLDDDDVDVDEVSRSYPSVMGAATDDSGDDGHGDGMTVARMASDVLFTSRTDSIEEEDTQGDNAV